MAGENMAELLKTRHIIPAINIPPKVCIAHVSNSYNTLIYC